MYRYVGVDVVNVGIVVKDGIVGIIVYFGIGYLWY